MAAAIASLLSMLDEVTFLMSFLGGDVTSSSIRGRRPVDCRAISSVLFIELITPTKVIY